MPARRVCMDGGRTYSRNFCEQALIGFPFEGDASSARIAEGQVFEFTAHHHYSEAAR